MGLFRRPRVDPEELAAIKEQVRFLREHWDAGRTRDEDLSRQVGAANELAERLSGLGDRLESAASPASQQPAIDDLAARLDDVARQLETWSASHDELRSRLGELDDRVSSVSTELANQITELGNDIDQLNSHGPAGDTDPARLDHLSTSQERLANEQARYQIAFREDLARLAEQLRRASTR